MLILKLLVLRLAPMLILKFQVVPRRMLQMVGEVITRYVVIVLLWLNYVVIIGEC